MRPVTRLHTALLFLLSILFLLSPLTLAAEDEDEDEYEETARVMRVSLMKGEVSLRRAGSIEWERAQLNLPLVEGDVLATGPDSTVEIQIDARNFIRVAGDSVLKLVTLRDEGIALSLSEGTASLRLAKFDRDREYFEIDAPGATIAAEKKGLYRLDVASDGRVRVTVRDDGRARIYSETSGFVLRNNKSAKLVPDGQGEADWEFTEAAALDEWDFRNDERERHLAVILRYEGRDRYYDTDVWGAEELDRYGDWAYTREYGYLWRPHVTILSQTYTDWAPYRYGHWRWCPPYGWTWIPDEQWGWAPYHYGRWVYYNNNWCWAPRGYGYPYNRARWRPALVTFVYIPTSYGEHIAWYPLTHGQRDPRGRRWPRQYDHLSPLRTREAANLRRTNPAFLRAVTSVPAREFGSGVVRARAASTDIAQRTVNGEPVRGRLPVMPDDVRRATPSGVGPRVNGAERRATGAGARPTLDITRPAPITPPRAIPERTTGAATRTPGVPLDAELRRARVFGNREPRTSPPIVGATDRGDDGTGAIRRPAPRPIEPRRPVEGSQSDNGGDGITNPVPRTRPTRPDSDGKVGSPDPASTPESRILRPARPDKEDGSGQPRPRPTRPTETRPQDSPTNERPEPRVRRPDAEERPQPRAPRREEPPSYQPERPAPREERPAPRVEPPARYEQPDPPPRQERPDPPPRQEQPRQEQPSPRQEAPPPRQEAPPAREERPAPPPPPQRDSAPKERPAPSERPSPRERPGKSDQR